MVLESRVCRYSAGKMVVHGPRGLGAVVLAAAQRVRGLVRRQFLTRNRRLALVLALVVVAIGAAAVRVSVSWFSPGVMILPLLAGGLLLWPRALRVLFVLIGAALAYDAAYDKAGPGSSRRSRSPRYSRTRWPGRGRSWACPGCAATRC
jgi:hypothetical protein